MAQSGTREFADTDVDNFVDFLEAHNLEAFFWRVRSFEEHAFRGNEFAMEAMRSDLQGLAVAVEHLARALGGTKDRLFEMFKQLWRNPQVVGFLNRDDTNRYARQARLQQDWPVLKAKIDDLRTQSSAASIVADLVTAHRIRGGVHQVFPEDDHFELERLFVSVMRAAVLTFVEVKGSAAAGSVNNDRQTIN
jgi:hypothetical protein